MLDMVFIHPCVVGAWPSTSISKFNVPLSNGCMNEWIKCSVIHHRTQNDSPLKSVLSVFLTSWNANFSLVNTEIVIRLNIYPREEKKNSYSACRKIKHIHSDTKEMLRVFQILFWNTSWYICIFGNAIIVSNRRDRHMQLIFNVKIFCHPRHHITWE